MKRNCVVSCLPIWQHGMAGISCHTHYTHQILHLQTIICSWPLRTIWMEKYSIISTTSKSIRTTFFKSKSRGLFERGIMRLPKRWNKIIEQNVYRWLNKKMYTKNCCLKFAQKIIRTLKKIPNSAYNILKLILGNILPLERQLLPIIICSRLWLNKKIHNRKKATFIYFILYSLGKYSLALVLLFKFRCKYAALSLQRDVNLPQQSKFM